MGLTHAAARRAFAPVAGFDRTAVEPLAYGVYLARLTRDGQEWTGSGLSATQALYAAQQRAAER